MSFPSGDGNDPRAGLTGRLGMAGRPSRAHVRFFTLGDADYFVGAVALVNSLRLVGLDERITFLDLGLLPKQRAILAAECDFVDVRREPGDHPWTYQPFAHLANPSGVCVILDSDVIVTRRLDDLVESARAGEIAAYADPDRTRVAPEWSSIFELEQPLRRDRDYVNSGLVAFDADRHRDFLARWWHLCHGMTECGRRRSDDPIKYADQDALNALLMSEYADSARVINATVPMQSSDLAQAAVVDVDRLECSYEGRVVSALHSICWPKPWMWSARYQLARSAYLTCLLRLLHGPGLRITLEPRVLPRWLRAGAWGTTTRWLLHAIEKLPTPLFVWAYRTKVRLRGEAPVLTPTPTPDERLLADLTSPSTT